VTISGSTGSVDPSGLPPTTLRLAVGPIPARTAVRMTLEGGAASRAIVRVWTAAGALARSWELSEARPASWSWNGRLRDGTVAPNGVYFVTVDAGGERLRRRLVWVR
jgi:hypothetical protein